jgi:hypothetical protein
MTATDLLDAEQFCGRPLIVGKGKLSKAHESLYRPAARAASTAIADSHERSMVEAIDRQATLIEKLNSEGPGIAENLTEGIE